MLTLGFTNHYYTLWVVTNQIKYGRGSVVDGQFQGECYHVVKYLYQQNLSMDYDAAIEKITAMAGERGFEEDLTLKGSHSFDRTIRTFNNMPDWQFTFGKLYQRDIRTSNDIWQLNRAMNKEPKPRSRVYARRRLVELGELVRFDWIEKLRTYDFEETEIYNVKIINVKHKYATPAQKERYEAKMKQNSMSDHYFTKGAKVELEVKEVSKFSFDTQYGTSYIQIFETKCGKIVKYMGASPLSFEVLIDNNSVNYEYEKVEWLKIKGTVKHSEYNGQKETRLQRIKILHNKELECLH